MDPKLFKILETEDKIEIQIVGIVENFQAKIIGFDSCPGRHPLLLVTTEGDWQGLKLRCGDYVIKRILTLIKCAICGAETSYTKGAPPEQREHYENGRQTCGECAKKND